MKLKVTTCSIILFFFLSPVILFAGGKEITQYIAGGGIEPTATVRVKDPQLQSKYASSRYSVKVAFVYGRENKMDLKTSGAFNYNVGYNLEFFDEYGTPMGSTISDGLAINWNVNSSTLIAAQLYNDPVLHNYPYVKLTVTYVSASMPSDVRLEVTLINESELGFVSGYSPGIDFNMASTQLYWDYIKGSEHYQVEWTYIDDMDAHGAFSTPTDPFNYKEPVRIQTANQYYKFDFSYPKGKIYMRVRGVGKFPGATNETEKYTEWVYKNIQWKNEGGVIRVFESSKNWEYSVFYTEDGNYKKQVRFFDETLKERQVLTNLSSENLILAEETKYDYEGRPVMDVFPVPIAAANMKFQTGLNVFSGGAQSKSSYDNSAETGPSPLSTNSGAAQYYSAFNNIETRLKDYIPHANGYPYTSVEYTLDGTGRISRFGNAGSILKLNRTVDGHARQYFYESAKSFELHRLFGDNVGDASHYTKETVIDENGQATVSYKDMSGRVIATALAGDSPDNVHSMGGEATTVDISLNDDNFVDPVNFKSTSTSTFTKLDNKPSEYTFTYKYDGVINKSTKLSTCKSCAYELIIKVTDPDGLVTTETETLKKENPVCAEENTFNGTKEFKLPLTKIGTYTVSKELKLKEGALNDDIAELLADAKNLSTYPKLEDVLPTYKAKIDYQQCELTCEDKCAAEASQFDAGTTDWQNAYNVCLSSCDSYVLSEADKVYKNQCSSYQDQMQAQLTSGQTLSQHYEYKFLQFCELMNQAHTNGKSSNVFDIELSTIKTWSEAENKGYVSPISNTPNPSAFDPYFNISWSWPIQTSQMNSKLQNFFDEAGKVDANSNGVSNDKLPLSVYVGLPLAYGKTSGYVPTNEEKWNLYKSLYMGKKEELKEAAKVAMGCPAYLNTSTAIFKNPTLPQTEAEMNTYISNAINASEAGTCSENVMLWIKTLSNNCDVTFSGSDETSLMSYLNAYCTEHYSGQDPFVSIYISELTTDNNLINAQNILNKYVCSLSAIAVENSNQTRCISTKDGEVCGISGVGCDDFSLDNSTESGLKFDGIDDYVNCGNNSSVNITGAITVEAWIKPGVVNTVQIIAAKNCTENSRSYDILLEGNRVRFDLFGSNDAHYPLYSPAGSIQANVWTHVAGTFDPYSGTQKIYVNGQSVASASRGNISLQQNSIPLIIGAYMGNGSDCEAPRSFFNGIIDEVRVWNVERTASDINAKRFCKLAGNESGLAAYYSFNSKTGTIAYDATSNGNNGTIIGAQWDGQGAGGSSCTASSGNVPGLVAEYYQLSVGTQAGQFNFPASAPTYKGTIADINLNTNTPASPATGVNGEFFLAKYYGYLDVPLAGEYQFRVQADNGVRLCIDGKNLLDKWIFYQAPATRGPVSKTLTKGLHKLKLDFGQDDMGYTAVLEWKKPGSTVFEPIPAGYYKHPSAWETTAPVDDFCTSCPEVAATAKLILPSNNTGGLGVQLQPNGNFSSTSGGWYDKNGILINPLVISSNVTNLKNYPDGTIKTGKILTPGKKYRLVFGFDISMSYWDANNLENDFFRVINGSIHLAAASKHNMMLNSDITFEAKGEDIVFKSFLSSSSPGVSISNVSIKEVIPTFNSLNVTVNGQSLLTVPVTFISGDPATTAINLAASLNAVPSDYIFTASGATINVVGKPGTGSNLNGIDIALRGVKSGIASTQVLWTSSMKGGKNAGDCCTNIFDYKISIEDYRTQCRAQLLEKATFDAQQELEERIEKFEDELIQEHLNNCFGSLLDENFYVSYKTTEHHYTLYYYDQAGNLVQTVPPTAVNPLTSAAFDPNTKKYIPGNSPAHNQNMFTKYRYNSLNQMVYQHTPDGGDSYFFYDSKGRLRISQNAKQAVASGGKYRYSYSKYDDQGRVVESGEFSFNQPVSYLTNTANAVTVAGLMDNMNWPSSTEPTLADITRTIYDAGTTWQENLRGRVASAISLENLTTTISTTSFSYDAHGNVKKLNQEIDGLAGAKTIDYEYDLISNKVTKVSYQKGQTDQFSHIYKYDSDNRLKYVRTSSDGVIWNEDARYIYYKHGPLARIELGENKVQGIDYYYTLQGWLKGVNIPETRQSSSSGYKVQYDPGKDGMTGANKYVAQDQFSFALGYYNGDYTPITSTASLGSSKWTSTNLLSGILENGLFNGNISFMINQVHDLGNKKVDITENKENFNLRAYAFQYDQFNRLRYAKSFQYSGTQWSRPSTTDGERYDADYTYDAMGNIITANVWMENGANGTLMDQLSYNYGSYNGTNPGSQLNNKLTHVVDAEGKKNSTDLTTQSANNYAYDEIGNLIKDVSEGISSITWTASGKVKSVTVESPEVPVPLKIIRFYYDAFGRRVKKITTVPPASYSFTTYYVRDASGNEMAIIGTALNSSNIEYPIYGASRLGEYQKAASQTGIEHRPNQTYYELSNHLGNVMVVITGHKLGVDMDGAGLTAAEYYIVDPYAGFDYYPFGMEIKYRSFSSYRYGFNGMEKDDDIKGSGNSYTTEFRQYDPRLGRWFSLDPVTYAYQSPYVNNNNNPIQFTDPGGDFVWPGALIGVVVGAITEVVTQVISNGISNRATGKGFFADLKIDWADVGVAAVEGFAIGSGVGLVSGVAWKAGGAFAKALVDGKVGDGFTAFGFGKTRPAFYKDIVGNTIGLAFGGFGIPFLTLGDVISSGIIRGSTKTLVDIGGKFVGGVADGLWGGFIGGAYNLGHTATYGDEKANTPVNPPTKNTEPVRNNDVMNRTGPTVHGNQGGGKVKVIQAGAFRTERRARSIENILKSTGHDVGILSGGGYHRVIVHSDNPEAELPSVIRDVPIRNPKNDTPYIRTLP